MGTGSTKHKLKFGKVILYTVVYLLCLLAVTIQPCAASQQKTSYTDNNDGSITTCFCIEFSPYQIDKNALKEGVDGWLKLFWGRLTQEEDIKEIGPSYKKEIETGRGYYYLIGARKSLSKKHSSNVRLYISVTMPWCSPVEDWIWAWNDDKINNLVVRLQAKDKTHNEKENSSIFILEDVFSLCAEVKPNHGYLDGIQGEPQEFTYVKDFLDVVHNWDQWRTSSDKQKSVKQKNIIIKSLATEDDQEVLRRWEQDLNRRLKELKKQTAKGNFSSLKYNINEAKGYIILCIVVIGFLSQYWIDTDWAFFLTRSDARKYISLQDKAANSSTQKPYVY